MRTFLLALLLLAPARSARALTPAAERHLDEGLVALYDLDYDTARQRFRRLIQEEPANPFGYLFESGAIWWQAANEYGLFKDTPTLEGVFERDIEEVLNTADALFSDKDKTLRSEAKFAAGMALGTRGQWNLMRGRWVKAYFDGKKAVKLLNKCVKLDPDFHDAYLGLGVYDYQAAKLPGVLKLSALLGVHGDARRGLERMQQAVDKGRLASRQAAQFLATLYMLEEKDFARALPLVKRLRVDFPTSPYFQFLELVSFYKLNRFEESLKVGQALFESSARDPAVLGRKQLSLFCSLSGGDCLSAQDLSASIEWLSRAIDAAPGAPTPWRSLCLLYRGIAHDILGHRSLAIDDFERVLAHPPHYGSHERAQRCMLKACTREEVVRELKAMTLSTKGVSP